MKLKVREIAVFAMLGAVMYASKMLMEIAPNVHLLGVFTIAFTVVYRKKALYPIYTYILLNGIFCGFAIYISGPFYGELPCCFPSRCLKKSDPLSIWSCAHHMDSCMEPCMHRLRPSCSDLIFGEWLPGLLPDFPGILCME